MTQTASLAEAEANDIQSEWMKLGSNGPEAEKQRVFKLMKRLPSSYISQSPSLGLANVMWQGTPASAFNETIEAAVRRAKALGVQTQLRWLTSGKWQSATK